MAMDQAELFTPKSSMSISVALATYNGGRFLSEQLASIARQTLPPDELVVSDDGSTDDTLDILRSFATTAPFPVRLLDKTERLGFSDNFLHAAGACRSDLVAFSDQDDVWLSDKIRVGFDRIVADKSLLSMHRLTVTDLELKPAYLLDQGIADDAVHAPMELDPQAGWGNTMMFRRELATLIPRDQRPRHPGFDRPLSHDTWLYSLAAALGRVSHIAAPLILYRQHGGNTAGVTPPSLARRVAGLHTEPTKGFRLKMELDEAIAALLADLATATTGPTRDRALAGAGCLAARSKRLADRIDAYGNRSAMRRLQAWLRTVRSLRQDPAAAGRAYRIGSKDLLLGVSGLDRVMSRRAGAQS